MKKIILYTSLFIVSLSIFSTRIKAAEIPGQSIDLILDQTNITNPTIISLNIGFNNPNRYMVVYVDNYLTLKEEDQSGTVLYEGQVKRTGNQPVGPGIPPAIHPEYIEIPANPLTINFPYFQEAHRLKVYDEAGTQLLDIDLTQYSIGPTPTAAPRYADCNKCGYCKSRKPPGDLDKCMACLYPDFVDNPDGTLAVDPIKNQPVQPRTGAYYSQLGCIDVGVAGFTDSGAAGGVLNVILTRLLFPIAGVLSLLALIYGAFLVMTAQGDAEQIGRGKKWIYGALIGTAFTFMSILLVRMIGGDILKIPGFD